MNDTPKPEEWFNWIDDPKPISIQVLRRKLRFVAESSSASPIVGVIVFKEAWPGEPLPHRSYMTSSDQEKKIQKEKDDALSAWRLDGGENNVDIWANITGQVRNWNNECLAGSVSQRRDTERTADCEKWEVEYCYAPTRNSKYVQATDPYPSKLFNRSSDDNFEEDGQLEGPPTAYDFAGSFDSDPERLALEDWKRRMKTVPAKDPILGVVVFSKEEYDNDVPSEGRSFACRSDAPYFSGEARALDGTSLDGLDKNMTLETMLDGSEDNKPWMVDYCYIPTRGGIPISAFDPAYALLEETPGKKGSEWLLREKDALIASQRMTIAMLADKIRRLEGSGEGLH